MDFRSVSLCDYNLALKGSEGSVGTQERLNSTR